MLILPVRTGVIAMGDDLAAVLRAAADFQPGDMVVVSSKAAATSEKSGYNLAALRATPDAERWAAQSNLDPLFCEAILLETARLNGRVLRACPGALLTEVRPAGMQRGTILTASAGLDRSNVPAGFAVGWPADPVQTARHLRSSLGTSIILSDSTCTPRRDGVTAFALAVAGIDPLRSEIGKQDLFGRPMQITVEAVADQLATAANAMMGNAAQSTPAAIIHDHGIPFSEFEGWVPGIEPDNDLFGLLS